MAYGAPDPSAPEGIGNLGNFIYVGTAAGQIYVTQDGGGSGTSNNWINISWGPSSLSNASLATTAGTAAAPLGNYGPAAGSSVINLIPSSAATQYGAATGAVHQSNL